MTLENPTITIREKTYPEPSMDRMKRKTVKKLKPALERMKNEDLDALWELVGLLVPGLNGATLDDLDMGECKGILQDAGIAKFERPEDDAEGDDDAEDGITPGESSALTNS
ncbi:hypothetical protein [Arthrobacter rhombi]|uniref:hypothetical protein n=1 Tax=Arthrobacter rhombi TaxID=71253 RepID=UPI003FCF4E36